MPAEKFKAIALVDPLASWVRVGILFVEYCADQDKVGKEVFRRGDKLYSKVLSNEFSRIDEWSTKDLKAYEAKVAEIMDRYWKKQRFNDFGGCYINKWQWQWRSFEISRFLKNIFF